MCLLTHLGGYCLADLQSGDVDVARDVYKRVLATDGEHPDALHFQGVVKHMKGVLGDVKCKYAQLLTLTHTPQVITVAP